ncbi:MAG: hypothetical protein E7434_01670 [Ruminococcaceae bacterium]|nr:hypothetical protein [Oscillospiraceae bacterium]
MAAKKQRRKVIIAGRYMRSIQYALTTDPDVRRTRAPKTQISSVAQEAMNLKHSWQKLKAVIAANFAMNDLVVTLTYRDDALPKLRKDAENRLKLFVRKLRAERRTMDLEMPYIYVTESGHSSGRLHHHIIITATGHDYDMIRRLWAKNGDDVEFSPIWTKGYDGWAQYLSKEPRENGRRYVGERMWRSSKGLVKPQVFTGWVYASDSLVAPPGAFVIDQQSRVNGYGEFTFIECMLPTNTTADSLALISDLR